MAKERTEPKAPLNRAESYNVAVQLYNQEFRTLGERTTTFLIAQSILAAALVTMLTIPVAIMRETLPYAFYPVASGIIVAGISYCILHYLAGRSGSQAAFRWRRYMLRIENNRRKAPWNWFYNDCLHKYNGRGIRHFLFQLCCERCLLDRTPLPSVWLISPAIFLMIWAFAIIYLVLRYMPEHGISWVSAPSLGTSIFIFLFFSSIIIWRWVAWWWDTRNQV